MEGVSRTAIAVAAGRAIETSRPDALMHDRFAADLVRRADPSSPFPTAWPPDPASADPLTQSLLLSSVYVGLRSRFIDDDVTAAGVGQVVILGSGLDTRAWRLPLAPAATVFELDSAEVTAFKDAALADAAPTAHRVALAADVTEPWAAALVRAGFRPDRPAHWILEGLLPYLGADDQRALIEDVVHLSAPGSRAVIERAAALDASAASQERLETYSRLTGLPMDEVLARTDPPDPAELLAGAGWEVARTSIADLERRYRRPLSLGPAFDDTAFDDTALVGAGPDRAGQAGAPDRGGFVTATRGD